MRFEPSFAKVIVFARTTVMSSAQLCTSNACNVTCDEHLCSISSLHIIVQCGNEVALDVLHFTIDVIACALGPSHLITMHLNFPLISSLDSNQQQLLEFQVCLLPAQLKRGENPAILFPIVLRFGFLEGVHT